MGPVEVTWMTRLALVLLRGVLFGFMFQRGQALKIHQVIDAMGIRDAMNGNVMFIAFAIGMLGVSVLSGLSLVGLQGPSRMLPANILGTLIIGVGLSPGWPQMPVWPLWRFSSFFPLSPRACRQKVSQGA